MAQGMRMPERTFHHGSCMGAFYWPCRRFSICFTMNRLVSKNRSTQFERHELSEREKLFPGVPVMHLYDTVTRRPPSKAQYLLVPAHIREFVYRCVHTCLGLFLFDEGRELLLLNRMVRRATEL